jgi:glycosyltransferase involved in cell wall biosynthesis
MQRYGALVRRWAPEARLVYCVADLHHLRAARRIAVEAGLAADAPEGSAATEGLRTAELLAALAADTVITHSSFEATYLAAEIPAAAVRLVTWDVPPQPADPAAKGVAFIGSYGHTPNLDAAYELLERVMPLVWAQDPTIPLLLAGSDLPDALRQAAVKAASGPVEVIGWTPDLASVFSRAHLSAAPLRYGAGLKGKVLDSLAAGLPCVCSPIAAEGMDLPATLHALVADGAAAMAATILRLHGDDEAHAALRQAGLAWVAESLSTERLDAALGRALGLFE